MSFIIHQNHEQQQIIQKPTTNNVVENRQSKIVTTESRTAVLATSVSPPVRVYTSRDGGYSTTYPSSWTTDLLPPLNTSGSGIPIFSTGPVGNKILGYPSFIKVIVEDNIGGLSLDEYSKQHFDTSYIFIPIIIADKKGEKASRTQGPVPTEIILFKHNNKIYEVIWYQGAEPKITQQQFNQFLIDMKFI